MSVLHPLPTQWTQSACLCPQMSYPRLWWKWTHHWQLRITSKVRPELWLGQDKQSMFASQIYGVKRSFVVAEVWYYFELCSLHGFWLESFFFLFFMEKGICQFYHISPRKDTFQTESLTPLPHVDEKSCSFTTKQCYSIVPNNWSSRGLVWEQVVPCSLPSVIQVANWFEKT